MKIFWLCNVVLSDIARDMGINASVSGGWLSGIFSGLCKNADVELMVCFPHSEKINGIFNGCKYCSFVQSENTEQQFMSILNDFEPDVIHIFGTEFSHTLEMVKVCEKIGLNENTIISIQGLVSVIAKHYTAFLPWNVVNGFSFRDLIKRENIKLSQKQFEKRGKYEIEAIKRARNVIGRTEWDKACVKKINKNINYFYCNENLRPTFYEKKWDYNNCEKNSIFVSQCSYPVKGFHLVLDAFADIIKDYPDAKLYVAGSNPIANSLSGRLRRKYYDIYLAKIIKKYCLKDRVIFLGALDDQQMCERFLKSNVFVSASSIENSSNSVGEAMLLGVPTVSSFVGGIPSMLSHGKEGFLYQADAPYMLANYVKKLFEDTNLQQSFSENSRLRAQKTHNIQINTETLIKIYEELL